MSLLRLNGISRSTGKVWWILAPSLALMALTASSQSQSLSEVSLTYLQRHGVPCQSVVKVDSTDNMDEIAICEDGREMALHHCSADAEAPRAAHLGHGRQDQQWTSKEACCGRASQGVGFDNC